MTRLEFLNATIAEKRGKIGDLLKSKPEKNFTTEELSLIKNLNDELAPLVDEQEKLKSVEKIITETESYLGKNNPIGQTLPGNGDGKPIGLELANGEVLRLRDSKGDFLSDSEIENQIKALALKQFESMQTPTGNGGLGSLKAAQEIADKFIKSNAFLKFDKTSRKSEATNLEIKSLLDTGGFPIASTRSNLILQTPLRRLVVADLLPNGNITQPRFLYMEETVATNNAATVAEGALKPESALGFTEKSADVRKIATVLPVTDELFEDAPAMRSYVQNRLTVFLQLREEDQLLNGDGNAPNILGLMNAPGIQSQAMAGDTIPDAIYKAITKVEVNSQLPVSGIMMNPFDWQTVRLSKDSNGNYLFGSPIMNDIERIFGYPVVKTTALAEGEALVGAFDLGAMILRRSGISFAASTEHADFFIYNKLMLRIEERLAMPIFRPNAFCQVTGLNA